MCSLTRISLLVGAMAGLVTFAGCQTHDRAAYHYEGQPVRTGSAKLETNRTLSGAPAADSVDLPPQPGQSGLEGPTLIP